MAGGGARGECRSGGAALHSPVDRDDNDDIGVDNYDIDSCDISTVTDWEPYQRGLPPPPQARRPLRRRRRSIVDARARIMEKLQLAAVKAQAAVRLEKDWWSRQHEEVVKTFEASDNKASPAASSRGAEERDDHACNGDKDRNGEECGRPGDRDMMGRIGDRKLLLEAVSLYISAAQLLETESAYLEANKFRTQFEQRAVAYRHHAQELVVLSGDDSCSGGGGSGKGERHNESGSNHSGSDCIRGDGEKYHSAVGACRESDDNIPGNREKVGSGHEFAAVDNEEDEQRQRKEDSRKDILREQNLKVARSYTRLLVERGRRGRERREVGSASGQAADAEEGKGVSAGAQKTSTEGTTVDEDCDGKLSLSQREIDDDDSDNPWEGVDQSQGDADIDGDESEEDMDEDDEWRRRRRRRRRRMSRSATRALLSDAQIQVTTSVEGGRGLPLTKRSRVDNEERASSLGTKQRGKSTGQYKKKEEDRKNHAMDQDDPLSFGLAGRAPARVALFLEDRSQDKEDQILTTSQFKDYLDKSGGSLDAINAMSETERALGRSTTDVLRPFWVLRLLFRALSSPRGGFLTPRVFLLSSLWHQEGVLLTSLPSKMVALAGVTAALDAFQIEVGCPSSLPGHSLSPSYASSFTQRPSSTSSVFASSLSCGFSLGSGEVGKDETKEQEVGKHNEGQLAGEQQTLEGVREKSLGDKEKKRRGLRKENKEDNGNEEETEDDPTADGSTFQSEMVGLLLPLERLCAAIGPIRSEMAAVFSHLHISSSFEAQKTKLDGLCDLYTARHRRVPSGSRGEGKTERKGISECEEQNAVSSRTFPPHPNRSASAIPGAPGGQDDEATEIDAGSVERLGRDADGQGQGREGTCDDDSFESDYEGAGDSGCAWGGRRGKCKDNDRREESGESSTDGRDRSGTAGSVKERAKHGRRRGGRKTKMGDSPRKTPVALFRSLGRAVKRIEQSATRTIQRLTTTHHRSIPSSSSPRPSLLDETSPFPVALHEGVPTLTSSLSLSPKKQKGGGNGGSKQTIADVLGSPTSTQSTRCGGGGGEQGDGRRRGLSRGGRRRKGGGTFGSSLSSFSSFAVARGDLDSDAASCVPISRLALRKYASLIARLASAALLLEQWVRRFLLIRERRMRSLASQRQEGAKEAMCVLPTPLVRVWCLMNTVALDLNAWVVPLILGDVRTLVTNLMERTKSAFDK